MTGIDGIDANPAIDNGDATATNFGKPSHTQDAIVSDALDLQEGSAADFRNKEFTNAGIAGNNYKNSKYEDAYAIYLEGLSLEQVAKNIGVTRQCVYKAFKKLIDTAHE